jgi:TRAP-type C4-dicarboxylate transport system permease large subunit
MLNLIIGIITPSMEIGLFVAIRVAETPPELVFRVTIPFFVTDAGRCRCRLPFH